VSLPAARDWRATARTLLRWLPGLAITTLAIWLLVRAIEWDSFLAALQSIPLGTILLVVVIYVISLGCRALGWMFLLQRKVRFWPAFLALNEGYFFNNILPFRIGELARSFLLGRRSRLGVFYVLSTVVVERFYDLAYAAALLLITLPLVLKLDWARPLAMVLLGLIVAGLAALYLAARNREWVEARVNRLAGRWTFVRRWVLPQIHAILGGFSVLTRVEYFAASLFFIGLCWALGILRDWLLISALVPGAPVWWAALGLGAANIFGAIPSVMGSLGTYELGGTGALSLVGMPEEAALAYLLITHVIHMVVSTLVGIYALSREGETISQLYSDIVNSRSAA
jgi:uncharacterized protein (TIRG00374 family)